MLLNMPCLGDSMFESVKAHKTFNTSKGCVFNRDLHEFSEEEILNMSPPHVQNVVKMKGESKMVLFTFNTQIPPDHITIGPEALTVRPFTERPLQCFVCFEFGHSKKNCRNPARCGRCSSIEHSTANCKDDHFCFHCRANHSVNSRQCETYKLEQEVVLTANAQRVSLGMARSMLQMRKGRGEPSPAFSAVVKRAKKNVSPQEKPQPAKAPKMAKSSRAKTSGNRFAPLVSVEKDQAVQLPTSTPEVSTITVTAEVHAEQSPPPKRRSKRPRRSSESPKGDKCPSTPVVKEGTAVPTVSSAPAGRVEPDNTSCQATSDEPSPMDLQSIVDPVEGPQEAVEITPPAPWPQPIPQTEASEGTHPKGDGLVTLTRETIKELPVPKPTTSGAGSKIPIAAPQLHKASKASSQRKPVIRPVILR